MNVFSKNGLKIDYTFSARKDDEWISFSPTVLAVVVAIARSKTRSERIIVHQNGSQSEVTKVLDNFMISFTSKEITSSLTIECEIVNSLVTSFDNIMETVNKQKEVKKPIEMKNQIETVKRQKEVRKPVENQNEI